MKQPKRKTTTEIICQNLGLPNQTIFQDYKCTLKDGFPFFGRLYIGEEHLMFVSNMFGIVKKTAVVIDTISKVTETSNDTITIVGKDSKNIKKEEEGEFVFSGFKNKNALKIIYALWKKEKLSSEVLNPHNDEESQIGEKSLESKFLDEGSMEMSFFNPEIVQTEKQKMVQLILPCSLDQFYKFFIADDAQLYSRKKHLEFKRATNIVVSPWKKNEEMNAEMREITALLKVKGVPFKSEANMSQVWLLTKRTQEQIILKVITQMADVPFSSYFNCEEHITIEKQGQTKCKFNCCTAIVFNKVTYLKNTILTRTFADLKEDYMQWSDNVKECLQKLKKSQEENEKRKSKPALNVEFESEKVVSPIKNGNIDEDRNLVSSSRLFNRIQTLNAKVTQLIILIVVLCVLLLGNFFMTLYLIQTSPSQYPSTEVDAQQM